MATSFLSNRQTLLAIGAALIAGLSLSAMDTVMKGIMAQGITPFFAQGVRGWSIFIGVMIMLALQGRREFRLLRPGSALMFLRGVLMFAGSILIFVGISRIEQATVTAMIFMYPMVVALLGTLVFGEHSGPRRIGFIVIGFAGVVLAAGFTPATFEIWALLPAGAAVLIALQAIMVRWAPKDMTNLDLSYLTSFTMAVCGTVFLFTHAPSGITWPQAGAFVAVGALGTIGTVCLAYAFKNAPMGLIGSLNYSSIIFSTLLAWVFFVETPPARVFLAMALIIASGIGYAYFQHRAEVARQD